MDVSELARTADLPELGTAMLDLMGDLFPICRSITGAGLRETLGRIGKVVPLELTEVPTGTTAFDWTVPKEWNVRDAWVADSTGRRVIDFQQSNLHVVNYSGPVRRRLTLDELRPHLHTLPEHPSWVPYRTSYYADSWGFCLSQDQLDQLPAGEYEAVIDTTLDDGSLTYGECVLPRRVERRDPDLGPLLPSLPGQRQPLRRRRRRLPRPGPRSSRPSIHLPLPVRSRHDRGDRLVVSQRGPARADPGRHRAGLRR